MEAQVNEEPQRRELLVSKGWVQAAALVFLIGFFILGLLAYRSYQAKPPVPVKVVDPSGAVLFTGDDVSEGQKTFLHNGLMEYGSVFGHGAYLGPDFTADYLRRQLQQSLAEARAEQQPLSLVILDLDDFSQINRLHGHAEGDRVLQALTQLLLLNLRHRFGFSGGTLIGGAIGTNWTRCTAAEVTAYLNGLGLVLDIDNNGALDPLTDGLLILRFTFGFTGTTLTNGAVAGNCMTRCDSSTILPYLQTLATPGS